MNSDRTFFHVSRETMFGPGISIWMRKELSGGRIAVPGTVTMRVLTENEQNLHHPPFLQLDREAGQQLMDELWNVGLRPSEGSGSAGSLAATQRHLDDMRALVFKQKAKI